MANRPLRSTGEVTDGVGTRRATVGELDDVADGCAGEVVDPDPDQLAARMRDLLSRLADQGHRGIPWVDPAEVCEEVDGQLEPQ